MRYAQARRGEVQMRRRVRRVSAVLGGRFVWLRDCVKGCVSGVRVCVVVVVVVVMPPFFSS